MNKEKQELYSKNVNLLIGDLNERLIERDELSRLVVLSLCSHSHMFLLGERGVAKSMTVELVNEVIKDSKFWQLQIGKDTTVKDLLGEKRSEEDGTLYYSSKKSLLNNNVVVLDEIFKADGRVLNVLLELLVDNAYTSGDGVKRKAEIISFLGTSNEFPTETYMLPLLDRFTFYYIVERIKETENRRKFYAGDYNVEKISKQYFDMNDLYFIKEEKNKIIVSEEIINLFEEITSELVKQAVKTSDRKFEKIFKNVIKTMAYLNNREEVNISDLFVLLHTAWHDYSEKEKVRRVIFEKIFGIKEEVDSKVIYTRQRLEEIDSYKNNILYDYLVYKKDIEGTNKQNTYDTIIEKIEEVWNAYAEIETLMVQLHNKFQFNMEIEKMLENNLFTIVYRQNTFTEDSIKEIVTLHNAIKEKKDKVEQWYTENKTLFDYQTNFRKGVHHGREQQ
jgi:MoxR-like ATPase